MKRGTDIHALKVKKLSRSYHTSIHKIDTNQTGTRNFEWGFATFGLFFGTVNVIFENRFVLKVLLNRRFWLNPVNFKILAVNFTKQQLKRMIVTRLRGFASHKQLWRFSLIDRKNLVFLWIKPLSRNISVFVILCLAFW